MKIKYEVIYRHHDKYPISVMCRFFGVSCSGYYGHLKRREKPEKDIYLSELIQEQQQRCHQTYGYRRMQIWLKKDKAIHLNPKTVLRVMKKYNLLSEIRRKRKWRQLGQQVHKYENLLNRLFQADRPNYKWVTDISYIHTKDLLIKVKQEMDKNKESEKDIGNQTTRHH